MPSLPELQRSFANTLAEGAAPRAPGFEVYRRAIDANYRRALGATFPVVRALVGAAFFDAAVDAFAAAHPSASGDLNEYGGDFGTFLARYEPASTLPYLPDVARLEWALDESVRAADVGIDPPTLIAAISVIEDDAIPGIRLALHPSCRLIASRFPVFEIWKVHQPGHEGDMRVEITVDSSDRLLVRRCVDATVVEGLGAGEHAWLQALQHEEPFGSALVRALEADAGFDLAIVLDRRVHDGTISFVRTP